MKGSYDPIPDTWFEMENRIRDILGELMRPISSQMGEILETCTEFEEEHVEHKKNFERHGDMIKKLKHQCDEIPSIQNSIVELNTRLTEKQFALTKKTDHILNEITANEERTRLIKEDTKALTDLNDALRADIKQCRKMTGSYHDSCITKINQASAKFNDDYIDIIERFNKLKANEEHYSNIISYQRDKVNEISAELELCKRNIKSLNVNLEASIENTAAKADYIQEKKTTRHELMMNRERTFQLETELKKINELSSFVQKEVPNKVNYMIAEILDYVLLKRGDRERIRKYIKYKSQNWPDIEKMKLQVMESTTNRRQSVVDSSPSEFIEKAQRFNSERSENDQSIASDSPYEHQKSLNFADNKLQSLKSNELNNSLPEQQLVPSSKKRTFPVTQMLKNKPERRSKRLWSKDENDSLSDDEKLSKMSSNTKNSVRTPNSNSHVVSSFEKQSPVSSSFNKTASPSINLPLKGLNKVIEEDDEDRIDSPDEKKRVPPHLNPEGSQIIQVERLPAKNRDNIESSSEDFEKSGSSGSTPRIFHSNQKIKLSRADTIQSPKKEAGKPPRNRQATLPLTLVEEGDTDSENTVNVQATIKTVTEVVDQKLQAQSQLLTNTIATKFEEEGTKLDNKVSKEDDAIGCQNQVRS
ncbi:unnamed protein product [Moneuplotes crassus]|uniref:Uncharacterized protein n=1 Tax=Euplotes crassus TaxID=5936 RepID=A0AAD1X8V8_EUPCR|nr:unnamed protein product [Moneuplotes crassus]